MRSGLGLLAILFLVLNWVGAAAPAQAEGETGRLTITPTIDPPGEVGGAISLDLALAQGELRAGLVLGGLFHPRPGAASRPAARRYRNHAGDRAADRERRLRPIRRGRLRIELAASGAESADQPDHRHADGDGDRAADPERLHRQSTRKLGVHSEDLHKEGDVLASRVKPSAPSEVRPRARCGPERGATHTFRQ